MATQILTVGPPDASITTQNATFFRQIKVVGGLDDLRCCCCPPPSRSHAIWDSPERVWGFELGR
ncbi:hypothetical protein Hanom_Chr08g00685841 [Helianthus anomalus]